VHGPVIFEERDVPADYFVGGLRPLAVFLPPQVESLRAGHELYSDNLVCVFEYLPSMLHAKTLMVDDRWSIVGSANLDIRSFRLNFELGGLVLDPVFARELEARFHRDLAQSKEVTEEDLDHRGYLVKLKDSFARLLSPLM